MINFVPLEGVREKGRMRLGSLLSKKGHKQNKKMITGMRRKNDIKKIDMKVNR